LLFGKFRAFFHHREIPVVRALAGRTVNTEHYSGTYTNFAGIQVRDLANQVIPFYIESPCTAHKKNRSDARGNFKN
jgi:hypothetical protein